MAVAFDRKSVFLLFMLTCISRYQAQSCSSNLTNTVVYEGSPAYFERVQSSQRVQWKVWSSSDFFYNEFSYRDRLIADPNSDVVVPVVSDRYAKTPSGLTIWSSTIIEMQEPHQYATAGLYLLRYFTPDCATAANLIVIRRGPYCSYDPSDTNNVKLLCSVDYSESRAQPNYPVFTWKKGTSVLLQEQPISSAIYSYLNRSTSEFVIDGNDATRYECQLTFSSTPNAPFDYVTSTAPNFTASCFSSRDFSTVPTYGPAAGGTLVTIEAKWTALPISISAVYIGKNLKAEINRTSTENVLVTTPEIAKELNVDQRLPVILEISPNSTNITTGNYFTYKPNPRINDVRPRELVISGGIRLTITGKSLDSVAQPLVRAAVVISRGSNITYYNQSFSSCFQATQNGAQMICLSPPIYIRNDFLQQLFGQTDPYTDSRRKRETIFSHGLQREDKTVLHDVPLLSIRSKRSASTFTNQNYTLGEEKMQIYVGMVFDGFKKYIDNILLDSDGSFSLCYPPTLNSDDHIEFDDNTITIQGDNLTQCNRPSDYTVRIGNGICVVESLTDNALTCSPPEKQPQQTENDTNHNCGNDFAVIVELGFKVYSCSCLKYPNDDPKQLIIIIATTVGSFAVVLVIIAVIVVVVRKSKKEKKQAYTREFEDNQLHRTDNSRITYRRQIDTLYVSSTPGGPYTTQLPGGSYGQANHMSHEHGGYLRPAEDQYQKADE